MMGWQRRQLDHMQIICASLHTGNHASTSPLSFFTGRMPFLPPNQQHQRSGQTNLTTNGGKNKITMFNYQLLLHLQSSMTHHQQRHFLQFPLMAFQQHVQLDDWVLPCLEAKHHSNCKQLHVILYHNSITQFFYLTSLLIWKYSRFGLQIPQNRIFGNNCSRLLTGCMPFQLSNRQF